MLFDILNTGDIIEITFRKHSNSNKFESHKFVIISKIDNNQRKYPVRKINLSDEYYLGQLGFDDNWLLSKESTSYIAYSFIKIKLNNKIVYDTLTGK